MKNKKLLLIITGGIFLIGIGIATYIITNKMLGKNVNEKDYNKGENNNSDSKNNSEANQSLFSVKINGKEVCFDDEPVARSYRCTSLSFYITDDIYTLEIETISNDPNRRPYDKQMYNLIDGINLINFGKFDSNKREFNMTIQIIKVPLILDTSISDEKLDIAKKIIEENDCRFQGAIIDILWNWFDREDINPTNGKCINEKCKDIQTLKREIANQSSLTDRYVNEHIDYWVNDGLLLEEDGILRVKNRPIDSYRCWGIVPFDDPNVKYESYYIMDNKLYIQVTYFPISPYTGNKEQYPEKIVWVFEINDNEVLIDNHNLILGTKLEV